MGKQSAWVNLPTPLLVPTLLDRAGQELEASQGSGSHTGPSVRAMTTETGSRVSGTAQARERWTASGSELRGTTQRDTTMSP